MSILIFKIAIYVLIIWLLTQVGNFCLKYFFSYFRIQKEVRSTSPNEDATADFRGGRIIGNLERVLIFLGIVFKSWEIVVSVITLKTIARYKEIDDQITAEYFLIGSLGSILWSILWTIIFVYYDKNYGFCILKEINELIVN